MSDENVNANEEEEEVIMDFEEHAELKELADASEDNASKAELAEQKSELLQAQLDEANVRLKAGSGTKAPSFVKTPVKAVFIRDSNPWEVSEGDKGYKKGEVVTFSSEDEYQRWHRRGACETPADTATRVKAEQTKEDADKEAARG